MMVWESKYTPLQNYLTKLHTNNVSLGFEAIEKILGFTLPKSAYRYPAWWGNNLQNSRHTRAWMDINWRTYNLNLTAQEVGFFKLG